MIESASEGHSSGEAPDDPPCTLCGEPGRVLFRGLEDRLFGAPGRWSLRECIACGLVWLCPRPSAAELRAAYAGYHTHTGDAGEHWLQLAVRREIPAVLFGYRDALRADPAAQRRGRRLAWIPPLRHAARRSVMGLGALPPGELLDVGCGAGLFLSSMRDLGWQVTGLEPDPSAADRARQRLGADAVHTGSLDDFDPKRSFDALTLSHVIEHFLDPEEALRRCHALLRPGGSLALATPNHRSLARHRFGADWRGWEAPRHIHVFDAGSLQRLVERAGFRVRTLSSAASAAPYVWFESAQLAGLRHALPLRAAFFSALEWLLVACGRPLGEEVLLVAERSESAP